MTPEDRQGYEKLLSELETTANRLKEISDGAFADMEGADHHEFLVSEYLYVGLDLANECLTRTINEARKVLKEA